MSRVRFLSLLAVACMISSCSGWKAPKHPTWSNTGSVEQMERLYWQAIKDHDWINLEAHTASNYLRTAPEGVSNKEQTLARYRALTGLEFSLGDFEVTDSGNTTVVNYTAVASFDLAGVHHPARKSRNLSVWQQQKKGWALIASSSLAIQ